MARAYASTVIDRDVDAVWNLVRAFDAVGRWIPGAKSCVTVEVVQYAAPIRRIVLADDTIIDEVLITLDDARRRIQYGFASTLPRGMRSFLGTAHVRPITNGDRTFIEWISEFDCDHAHEAKLVGNVGAMLAELLAAVTAETSQRQGDR